VTLSLYSIVRDIVNPAMKRGPFMDWRLSKYITTTDMRPECQKLNVIEHNIISKNDNTQENPGPYRAFFALQDKVPIFW
jgi:hypothetical protein